MLVFVVVSACSPVRSRESMKSKPLTNKESIEEKNETKANTSKLGKPEKKDIGKKHIEEKKPILKRFSDTTFLYVGEYRPVVDNKPTQIQKSAQLELAIKKFDDGDISSACEDISNLLQSVSKESGEYPEVLFYTAECYIAKNAFDPARKILVDLLSLDRLTVEIKEKSLVRLGQIYCVEGNKIEAERLFKQLRREFPSSLYLPIATCEAIGS